MIDAVRQVPLRPRERITFEYVLLGGVTDQPEHAREVARLVRRTGLPAKVNLIAWNPGPGIPYAMPKPEAVGAVPGDPDRQRESPPISASREAATSSPPAASSSARWRRKHNAPRPGISYLPAGMGSGCTLPQSGPLYLAVDTMVMFIALEPIIIDI